MHFLEAGVQRAGRPLLLHGFSELGIVAALGYERVQGVIGHHAGAGGPCVAACCGLTSSPRWC